MEPFKDELTANKENHEKTKEDLIMENRSLKESLNVCLEFKRILDHMLSDKEVIKSEAVQKWMPHCLKKLHTYKLYRQAFGDYLETAIDNIDDQELTKCFSTDCTLPSCSELPSVDGTEDDVTNKFVPSETKQQNENISKSSNESLTKENKTSKNIEALQLLNPSKPLSQQQLGTQKTKNVVKKVVLDKEAVHLKDNKKVKLLEQSDKEKNLSVQITKPSVNAQVENKQITTDTKKTLFCNVIDCNFTFSNVEEIIQHSKIHSKIFKCSACSFLFSDKSNVLKHLDETHKLEKQNKPK